jgi:uncharacterized protein GlcG (DUF336 family)
MKSFKKIASAAVAVATLASAVTATSAFAAPAAAPPVKWVRSIPLSLALEAAQAALKCSQDNGFNASVGVMDFAGQLKVLLVPDGATLIGQKVLIKKMNATLLRQQDTGAMVALTTAPGARAEIDTSSNVLERIAPGMAVVSPGAEPIFIGSGPSREFVGVLGVGGANGPIDLKCPKDGLAKIQDRLK